MSLPHGERVRALKLQRAVTSGMLLMWDRGLHFYAMVQATLAQGCDYLERVPTNVKFMVAQPLEDGFYLAWIAPSGKLKRKGCQRIQVRVIEYTIDSPDQPEVQQVYRLITSLMDTPAISGSSASD